MHSRRCVIQVGLNGCMITSQTNERHRIQWLNFDSDYNGWSERIIFRLGHKIASNCTNSIVLVTKSESSSMHHFPSSQVKPNILHRITIIMKSILFFFSVLIFFSTTKRKAQVIFCWVVTVKRVTDHCVHRIKVAYRSKSSIELINLKR